MWNMKGSADEGWEPLVYCVLQSQNMFWVMSFPDRT